MQGALQAATPPALANPIHNRRLLILRFVFGIDVWVSAYAAIIVLDVLVVGPGSETKANWQTADMDVNVTIGKPSLFGGQQNAR